MAGSPSRRGRYVVAMALVLVLSGVAGCGTRSVATSGALPAPVGSQPAVLDQPVPGSPSSSRLPTVTVAAAANGEVGTGFAGFSYEKDRIGAGVFDAHDTSLVNLFRLLGPSVLRLGGNLVDIVNWNAAGAGGSAGQIAPADVQRLAGFLHATGWKVIYGINLKTNTAANGAAEAAFVAATLGSSLLAFEIGNEPNEYHTEQEYEAAYNTFAAAIATRVPTAVFAGPGPASATDWLAPFATHERANRLMILSMHTYIRSDTRASIPAMLASTAPGATLAGQWNTLAGARAAARIPQWRMTETNSFFHGGTVGVSDVQAAALWALDFMYGVAAHQGSGVNFHGGTSVQFPLHYTPILFNGVVPVGVQAVYYAELLWSLAGTGQLHAAQVTGAPGATAWGIGNNVIINNEGGTALTLTVTLATAASRALAYPLTAAELTSKTITIAGSAVSVSGGFHPNPQPLPVTGATVSLTVPAHTATLIVTA